MNNRFAHAVAERECVECEAQRRFVTTAAHELRTPVTSLHGMLGLLEDTLAGDVTAW